MLSTMIKFIKLEMFYSNFITYIKSNLGKFLNFYLRLVNLPTVFVTKKVSLLFIILLFYSLTFFYIKNFKYSLCHLLLKIYFVFNFKI